MNLDTERVLAVKVVEQAADSEASQDGDRSEDSADKEVVAEGYLDGEQWEYEELREQRD